MGIARGIQFLHTGTQHGIFGNDLSIQSVLLDDNLTAKISSYNISLSSKVGSESPLHGHDTSSQVSQRYNIRFFVYIFFLKTFRLLSI